MPPKIDVQELHAAAITSGIDREALLSGIDRRVTSSIPRLPSRAAQLLRDLYELEALGTLPDGTNPLRIWLLNASTLTALRLEEKVFRRALALLDPDVTAATTPPVTAATTPPVTPHETTPVMRHETPRAAPSKGLLYISASPKDGAFVERFRRQLTPFARQGLTVWDRIEIRGGEVTARVVQQKLAAATLFVPLLSSDYLAEKETYEELQQALKRPDLEMVPVLVRPCMWSVAPELSGRTVLPKNKKPLTSHSDVESALAGVVEELQNIVAGLATGSRADIQPRIEHDDIDLRQLEGALPAPTTPRPLQNKSWSLYQCPTYPWPNLAARELQGHLMVAYPVLEDLRRIANVAGVNLNRFQPGNGAIEPAWESLLEVATRQTQLKALIDAVLSDVYASSQHVKIRATLARLGVK